MRIHARLLATSVAAAALCVGASACSSSSTGSKTAAESAAPASQSAKPILSVPSLSGVQTSTVDAQLNPKDVSFIATVAFPVGTTRAFATGSCRWTGNFAGDVTVQ